MAVLFFDASAAVKRYVNETGSRWVSSLIDPAAGNECWLATISQVEVLAALFLRVRTGTLTPLKAQQAGRLFRGDLRSRYQRVRFSAAILNRAMTLVALYLLRAYDALQLASALRLQAQSGVGSASPLTLVSADQQLNRAAVGEGLRIDDPNQHP